MEEVVPDVLTGVVVLTGGVATVVVVLTGVAVSAPIWVEDPLACAAKILKAGIPKARAASKAITQIAGVYLFKHIPLSY
jgi:hypothetical protein